MVEWFKAHAWKACDVKASGGSNPLLSANKIQLRQRGFEPKGSHRKRCLLSGRVKPLAFTPL